MLILICDGGFRYSELSPVRWKQVDFANAQATVIGKGEKQRTVPLSPVTLTTLRIIQEFAKGSKWCSNRSRPRGGTTATPTGAWRGSATRS